MTNEPLPAQDEQILAQLAQVNRALRDIRDEMAKLAKLIEDGRKAQDRQIRALEDQVRSGRRTA